MSAACVGRDRSPGATRLTLVGVGREFVRKTGLGGGGAWRRRLQRSVGGSVAQRVRQRDAVAAGEGDVVVGERADALDVFVTDGVPSFVEVVEGALGVDRVVERDAVDDEAERGELFFLALVVGLAELAAAAVEDLVGERVAALAAVELGEDAPTQRLVVAVVEQVDRFGGASDLGDRAGQVGEVAGVASERVHELAAGGVALQQAAGDSEQVVSVVGDQVRGESVAGEVVEWPVVGGGVKPPEPGAAGVCESRGELVAEQS